MLIKFTLLISVGLARVYGEDNQNSRVCGYTGDEDDEGECLPCEEVGTIYSSIVITVESTGKVEECRSFCQIDHRCSYFSLDTRREFCHLKNAIGTKLRAPSSYVSGPKYCNNEKFNEIDGDLTESELLEDDILSSSLTYIARGSRNIEMDRENETYPVVIIKHEDKDYSTILAGVPANFGLNISKNTKVTGRAVFAQPGDLCNFSPSDMRKEMVIIRLTLDVGEKLFAVVRRGLCTFSTKAENAVSAGFDGMLILDTLENTSVKFITGNHKDKLKEFPIVFLKKEEADILERSLQTNKDKTILTIQDSSSVIWYNVKSNTTTTTTTTATTTTTSLSTSTTTTTSTTTPSTSAPMGLLLTKALKVENVENDGFVVGMRRRPSLNPFSFWNPSSTEVSSPSSSSYTPQSTVGSVVDESTQSTREQQTPFIPGPKNVQHPFISVKMEQQPQSIVHFTPLSVGAIIGSLVLALFLVIAIFTLIFGRLRKNSRRRENHLRCQQALSQIAERKGEDNVGFDEAGSRSREEKLPKSVKYLFECPVCLDFAWSPRKIFQCREGHIVCEVCYNNPDLQTCPICRIPIRGPGQVSRNRQLEELSAALLALEPSSSSGESSRHLNSQTESSPSAPPMFPSTITTVMYHSEDTGETTDEAETFEEIDSYSEAGPLTVILPPE